MEEDPLKRKSNRGIWALVCSLAKLYRHNLGEMLARLWRALDFRFRIFPAETESPWTEIVLWVSVLLRKKGKRVWMPGKVLEFSVSILSFSALWSHCTWTSHISVLQDFLKVPEMKWDITILLGWQLPGNWRYKYEWKQQNKWNESRS